MEMVASRDAEMPLLLLISNLYRFSGRNVLAGSLQLGSKGGNPESALNAVSRWNAADSAFGGGCLFLMQVLKPSCSRTGCSCERHVSRRLAKKTRASLATPASVQYHFESPQFDRHRRCQVKEQGLAGQWYRGELPS
jgi:hypothetical protein